MNRKIRKGYVFSRRDLIAAAKEGLEALKAGKLGDLRTTTIELPKPAPRLDAKQNP